MATPEGAQASDLPWLHSGIPKELNYSIARRVIELPVGGRRVKAATG
jgi:hypothetical protein